MTYIKRCYLKELENILDIHNSHVVLNGRKCNLSISAQSINHEVEHEGISYTIKYFKKGKRVAHNIRFIKKLYQEEVSAYDA